MGVKLFDGQGEKQEVTPQEEKPQCELKTFEFVVQSRGSFMPPKPQDEEKGKNT